MMDKFKKYLFLFWFGGTFYITLETICRGYSLWTMGILAGIVFILIGLINELYTWEIDLLMQVVIGTIVATFSEFVAGCILNLWLKWNIWDYSDMWGNVLGQICPLFIMIWIPITLVAIILDDIIRWKFLGEEKPQYYIFKKQIY